MGEWVALVGNRFTVHSVGSLGLDTLIYLQTKPVVLMLAFSASPSHQRRLTYLTFQNGCSTDGEEKVVVQKMVIASYYGGRMSDRSFTFGIRLEGFVLRQEGGEKHLRIRR